MLKKSLLFIMVMSLTACANTMNGVAKDSTSVLNTASDFAHKNRDALNKAASETGELLRKGGNLLGKGMTATGELLQEMTAK